MENIYLQRGNGNNMQVSNESPKPNWFLVAIVTAVLAVIAGLTQEWWSKILWPIGN